MEPLVLIFSLAILIASSILTNYLLTKFQNLPPGPLPLPILGHLHLLRDPLHRTLSTLSRKHGPIILLRFGSQRALVVSSPEAANDCLCHNDIVFASRPRVFAGDILAYNSTTLAWVPYGSLWRNLRRLCTIYILSQASLRRSSGERSVEVRSIIRRVHRESSSGITVEIGRALFDLTHDVMMRVLAREGYNGKESKRFREVMKGVMRTVGMTTSVDLFPWLKFFGFDRVLKKKFMGLAEEQDRFLEDLMKKNYCDDMGSNRRKKTLIEVLLKLQKIEPDIYTDEIIKGLFHVLLLGGTDTTAGTIEWALSLMLNNPAVLQKTQREIDAVVGHDRLISESDLDHLPYLQCVIKETLRLYPIAPLLIPHQSSEKCVVGGYAIPRGTMLLVNVWAMHNDPKYWEEPTKFKPERFEQSEDSEEMKFKFMPFGSGRRACPGQGLAMQMVGLGLGSLLQCFDWERPGQELVDMGVKAGLMMPKAEPLQAKCRLRDAMAPVISEI